MEQEQKSTYDQTDDPANGLENHRHDQPFQEENSLINTPHHKLEDVHIQLFHQCLVHRET
ncbi:hypothetical protein OKN5_37240 [Bacillus altitudinis]